MAYADGQGISGAVSVDLGSLLNEVGSYIITYWVAPSVLEAGSGFSMDATCTTDDLGYSNTQTGGTGDGNSAVSKTGIMLLRVGGTYPFPVTFDIGYFSPLGDLRLDYAINMWRAQS